MSGYTVDVVVHVVLRFKVDALSEDEARKKAETEMWEGFELMNGDSVWQHVSTCIVK